MRSRIALFVIAVFLYSSAPIRAQVKENWLEDYAAIKRFMGEAYANLGWAHSRMDLIELDKRTTEALKQVDSDADARVVIDKFLAEFHDGHLKLENAGSGNTTAATAPQRSIPADANAVKACGDMGYRARLSRFSIPFEAAVPGFRRVNEESDPFPSGVFSLANGNTAAVINIPIFSPQGYYPVCAKEWEDFRGSLSNSCDEDCTDRFNARVEKSLTGALERQIRALAELRPDHFIIDIGRNGGGTNWVKTVALMFSAEPLKPTRSGFIRHPHWVAILKENLRPILSDLTRKDISPKQRQLLKQGKKRLERLVAEAGAPCDMFYVWTTRSKRKGCTNINSTPVYSSGLFQYLDPKLLAGLASKDILFKADDAKPRPVILRQKPVVLVDSRTASAAENFASFLQAAGSGTVVGERTLGAGCGYVNGGTKYFLPYSKLRLRMPDCVRYQANGVNEVEGIQPDVTLWERAANPATRLSKVLEYLSNR